ncbi:hypothetical protein NAL94_02000 [Vibrio alginolyticus]|uniref:hypothetical protein n=1 Tax=Vibrio TaxID=662 RepID=UPI00197F3B3F|nr:MULTISPECIES: hypothetical protein [Vibrio]MDW1837971.1 hypothetical protein [Vibrio sp. Vb0718]QSI82915.1 hypothetical protein JYG29_22725 [Vibrio alginolyticus]URR26717.1 hypothetical protein NAL94_02000 [Vibrio alginolyticus]
MADLPLPSSLPNSVSQEGILTHSLREQWLSELKKHGCSTTLGTSIDEYAAAFSNTHNVPKSSKALQTKVGGEFKRVRIAFKLLSKATKPIPIIREKSTWFVDIEQRLNSVLKEEMSTIWRAFDTEVQYLVRAQTQDSLNQITELEAENIELAEFIDELQRQSKYTEELQKSTEEVESKLAHAEQVCSSYEQRNNELREQLHELLTIQRDLDVAIAKSDFLEQQVQDLKVDKQRLLQMLSQLGDSSRSGISELPSQDDQVIIPDPDIFEN